MENHPKNHMADSLLKIAIEASVSAGIKILEVYDKGFQVQYKSDNSPLTAADEASNKIINEYLEPTGIPIISEENKQTDYAQRESWQTCWMVDPLDGTKEFIKGNGEFTVNIALIEKGLPQIGVIYVPVSRELYYADVLWQKAFKIVLNKQHELPENPFLDSYSIAPSRSNGKTKLKVVGSRSHLNDKTKDYIEDLKRHYREVEVVSKGSSLKFCLMAEGKADVYPRFAPTMEWDTAAGQAICQAVGLKVMDMHTNKVLRYNKENLLNNYFLVSS